MKYRFLFILFILSCTNETKLNIHSSIDSAFLEAKKRNNNILLVFDFHGNPTNSVKKTITDQTVVEEIKGLTVAILYVDEAGEEGTYNRSIQVEKFGTSTQPMLYMLNNQGEIIKGPIGYREKNEILNFIRHK